MYSSSRTLLPSNASQGCAPHPKPSQAHPAVLEVVPRSAPGARRSYLILSSPPRPAGQLHKYISPVVVGRRDQPASHGSFAARGSLEDVSDAGTAPLRQGFDASAIGHRLPRQSTHSGHADVVQAGVPRLAHPRAPGPRMQPPSGRAPPALKIGTAADPVDTALRKPAIGRRSRFPDGFERDLASGVTARCRGRRCRRPFSARAGTGASAEENRVRRLAAAGAANLSPRAST